MVTCHNYIQFRVINHIIVLLEGLRRLMFLEDTISSTEENDSFMIINFLMILKICKRKKNLFKLNLMEI